MMTDREIQSLRNLGNECERAADEIEALRAERHELMKSIRWALDFLDDGDEPGACSVLREVVRQRDKK